MGSSQRKKRKETPPPPDPQAAGRRIQESIDQNNRELQESDLPKRKKRALKVHRF